MIPDFQNAWDQQAEEFAKKWQTPIEGILNKDQFFKFLGILSSGCNWSTVMHSFLKPFRMEWRIFDQDLMLAGSVDALFEDIRCRLVVIDVHYADPFEKTGKLWLVDWKRSMKISFENPFQYGLQDGPFANMSDCNFNHYSLQLNTYRSILEKRYQLQFFGMFLIVFHPQHEKYERVNAPLLFQPIQEMFQQRKIDIDNHQM